MNTFLIIMAIVLWVTFRSFSKNAAKAKAAPEDYSSPSANDVPEGTFESLFSDDNIAFDEEDPYAVEKEDYSEQAAVEHAFSSQFAAASQQPSYFSYEETEKLRNSSASAPSKARSKARTKEAPVQGKDGAINGAADFDLRQAVIYQTILTNKYLDEVSSYEN